jgi:hypothetical protein
VSTIPATTFTATTGVTTVALDLNELRDVTAAVEHASGSGLGDVTVVVTARAETSTVVAGRTVPVAASAPLTFHLGDNRVSLDDDKHPTRTASGHVDLPGTKLAMLALGPLKLPVLFGRILAVLLGLAALLVGAGAMVAAQRVPTPAARSAQVAHRYRSRIVLVQDLGPGPVVDLVTAEDFFRLADQSEEAVLHYVGGDRHVYQIEYGSARYRYTVEVPLSAVSD